MNIKIWTDGKIDKPSRYDESIRGDVYYFVCKQCDLDLQFSISHIDYDNFGKHFPNQFRCPDCGYNHILWWDFIRYYLQEK